MNLALDPIIDYDKFSDDRSNHIHVFLLCSDLDRIFPNIYNCVNEIHILSGKCVSFHLPLIRMTIGQHKYVVDDMKINDNIKRLNEISNNISACDYLIEYARVISSVDFQDFSFRSVYKIFMDKYEKEVVDFSNKYGIDVSNFPCLVFRDNSENNKNQIIWKINDVQKCVEIFRKIHDDIKVVDGKIDELLPERDRLKKIHNDVKYQSYEIDQMMNICEGVNSRFLKFKGEYSDINVDNSENWLRIFDNISISTGPIPRGLPRSPVLVLRGAGKAVGFLRRLCPVYSVLE